MNATHAVPSLLVLAMLSLPLPAHAIDTEFLFSFGSFGSGNGQFNTPTEIAIGPSGDVFVFDEGNGRIQKFNADGVYLTQWSSNRPGYPATTSIAIGAGGNVLLQAWHYILHYDPSGNYLYRLELPFASYPPNFRIDTDAAGNLYWSRQVRGGWNSVSRYSSYGLQDPSWSFSGGYYTSVCGAAIAADGTFFFSTVTDAYPVSRREILRRISNTSWTTIDGYGRTLDVDDHGHLFAANHVDHRIDVWTTDGIPVVSFGSYGTGPGQFRSPWDIEVTPAGRIYVVDKENDRIQVFGSGAVPAQASTWGRVKADYR